MPFLSASRPDPVRVFMLFVWMAIGAAAAGFLAPWHWMGDMAAHFRVYYACFLIPSAIALFALRRRVTGGIALAAALTVLPGFLPYYLPPPAMAAEGAALRVASLNVLSSNRGFDAALREVRALNPDIVFFMEVNGAWNARLAALKDAWPYALECPEEDNFGVLLLSRIPWKAAEIRSWSGLGVPSVEARFDLQGRNLTLYGIHPVPPSGGAWTRHRDRQLARVAEAARSREGSVIVLGDFNTTPWAPSFGRFLEASGLRDAALGFGIGTTWRNPLGFIRLPIDHICVSRDIAVRDYRIGGDIGSDHFPVCADLVLRP